MLTLYRFVIVPAACAIALTTGLAAHAQDAEVAVRAGDSTMTCEAIIAEMNTLTAAQAAATQRAEGRARAGRGLMNFARGALSAAAPMLAQGAMSGLGGGMGDGMGSAVAQMAVQQAQTQAMTAAMTAGQPQPPAAQPAPAAQSPRVQHLNGLLMQRGC
ncbi:MAG: hypothetical protein EON89_07930 [Brevundimonas sp.]|nr:MAG: hypothetical protein EON89_07930 [Brevundimonas sp.]